MANKNYLLLLLLFTAQIVFAAPVTKSDALRTAKRFLQAKGIKMKTPRMAYAAPRKQNKAKTETPSAYYVFNAGSEQGFVVVSGDDRTEKVLGYSDTGSFNLSSVPENMRSFLQSYADQINQLDKQNENMSTTVPGQGDATRNPIRPLLKCNWNQDGAYNQHCPKSGKLPSSKRFVTGCVATAMAQTMYYHQWPEKTTATIPTYTTFTKNVTVPEIPANSTLSWKDMLPEYTGTSDPKANVNAVADLMAWVGAAVKMDYNVSAAGGSGAITESIAPALYKYFDYSAYCIDRKNMTSVDFDNALYKEMKAHRPVVFCGASTGGGHCFVIDGYDGQGLYHVNWGWGGMSNGYFLISVLNPDNTSGIGASTTNDGYAIDQQAVIGIQPGAPANLPKDGLKMGITDVENRFISLEFSNGAGIDGTFDYAVGIIDDQGNISGEATSIERNKTLKFMYSYSHRLYLSKLERNKTYKLTPVSRVYGTTEWTFDPSMYVIVHVDANGRITNEFDPITRTDKLELGDLQFIGDKTTRTPQPVKFSIKNNGNHEFYGTLYLFVTEPASTTREEVALISPTVKEGQTIEVEMQFTPASTGKHTLYVTSDDEGKDVLKQGDVTITSANSSSVILGSTFTINGEQAGTVYGNKISGKAHIKSTAGDYNGNINVGIFDSSSQYALNLTSVNAKIKNGESIDVDFAFGGLSDGQYTLIAFKGYQEMRDYKTVTLKQGIISYMADGTELTQPATSNIVVNEAAAAVDLSSAVYTSVKPNSNPNTLYYVSRYGSTKGLENKNVIVNGVAANIELTDGKAFYCPVSFKAEKIAYTRILKQALSNNKGWETLSLPFDATKITADGNDIDWYKSATDKGKQFWLMSFSEQKDNIVYFSHAPEMSKDLPYLIGVPAALVNKQVRFSAKDAEITADNPCMTSSPRYTYYSSATNLNSSRAFGINEQGSQFDYQSAFAPASFRAFFAANEMADATTNSLLIRIIGTTTDGIQAIDEAVVTQPANVFDLQGRKVARLNAGQTVNSLPKGIYMMNGKKIVVR